MSNQNDRRLRVLALGFRGFPGVQGGIETHAEQLYARLQGLGCDVEAVVRAPHVKPGSPGVWRGIRFRRIWSPRTSGIEAGLHTLLGVLYAIVRRPDVVHVHGIGPALLTPLARIFNLPVVVTHHGPDYDREKWGWLARSMLRLGERVGMLTATETIAISQAIAEIVAKKHGITSHVIRNGVELPATDHGSDLLQADDLESGRYVLCVGRLVPEKRHIDLIDAFAKAAIPGWKLAIVGSTVGEDPWVRKVVAHAANTPSVVCTGFRSGPALAQLFANAGLFVLPSSHEGLPIALLEALSYGLPVAASDIPAHRECPLDPDAYFPVGNVGRMVECMREAASRPITPDAREQRRNAVASMCDWDLLAADTLAVLEMAARGRGPQAVTPRAPVVKPLPVAVPDKPSTPPMDGRRLKLRG